tara:strand:- start:449 stop:1768 length:1320 start_codon:yes stop_codon:yes gene_type:complete
MNLKNPFNNNKKSSKSYLLKNGFVIDPEKKKIEKNDILIKNTLIEKIGKSLTNKENNIETIDCTGLYVSPGLVDMRVHISEPGLEHKETIKSASMSAASGGITSMICMPNTIPPIDQPAIIQSIQRKAREVALSKIFCTGCITRSFAGKEICELHLMKESGAVGFTDGLKSIKNSRVMRRALNYAKSFNGLIIQHAEDPDLRFNGTVNEGEISTRMGLVGIPSFAEAMIVQRDLWLVKESGCRYHVGHISSKETVEIIRKAKKDGLPITCDTAPPYFILNELALENYRTFSKLSPPLRKEDDRTEIINGLIDGTIDAIVSDHSPHDQDAKRLPFNQAEFGGVGLETLLPLTLSLVKNKKINLAKAISLMTINPAKILNLKIGSIETKSEADLIIFDLARPWKVNPEKFFSKSKNSPFDGMPVEGKNLMTFVRGRLVYKL